VRAGRNLRCDRRAPVPASTVAILGGLEAISVDLETPTRFSMVLFLGGLSGALVGGRLARMQLARAPT
jgi:hypothetical protein